MLPGVSVKPEFSSQTIHSDHSTNSEPECQHRAEDPTSEEECSPQTGFMNNLSPSFCVNTQPFNVSASLKAYADRMQADYFRYRIAKESAENFYNRLAVFHNTFNPFRYYLNPFTLRQFGCPPPPTPGPGSPASPPGVDLSLKPSKQFPLPHPQCFEEVSNKKRHCEDTESGVAGEKRQKLSLKRKVGKK